MKTILNTNRPMHRQWSIKMKAARIFELRFACRRDKMLLSKMAFLITFWGILAGCSGEKPNASIPKVQVDVSSPIKKTITEWDEFTGRFEATNRIDIRARVSGYIDRVNFKDGQLVNKGDVLFVIDQRPFEIALQQARALYGQAEANYKQATANFDRVKPLKQTGAVSIEEYDSRQQAVAGSLASLQVAQAAIDKASLELEFTKVTAPISGRVGRDFVNPGNLISGGTPASTVLTTLVATNPIHFYFSGSESEFLKYSRLARNGQRGSSRDNANPVEIRLADEKIFAHKGAMDFVNNEISRGTGAIEARAILENKDGLLEPGMFGRARLQGRSEYEVIIVPDDIVGTNQTVKFLYTVGTDSLIKATPVELGGLYQNRYRIITGGLNPDDKIVISNIQRLQPQMKVSFAETDVLKKEIMALTDN